MKTKTCTSHCGRELPDTQFAPNRGRKCRQCHSYDSAMITRRKTGKPDISFETWLTRLNMKRQATAEADKLFAAGKQRCARCREVKDILTEFPKAGHGGPWPPVVRKDVHSYCKVCKCQASVEAKRRSRDEVTYLCPEPYWKGEHNPRLKALLKETW